MEKIMRFTLVLCALACAVPIAAGAQEWVKYAGSPDGDEGFLDRNTLKVKAGIRTIWSRLEKRQAVSHNGQPLKTWFTLTQVVCEHRLHRTLQEAGYGPDGLLLFDTTNPGAEFRPVVSETFGDVRLAAICELPMPVPPGKGS